MSCARRLLIIHHLNISGEQTGSGPRWLGRRAGGKVNGKQLEQANRVMSDVDNVRKARGV